MHLPWINRLVALRADHDWLEIVAAGHMPVQQRPALLVGHVNIAPVNNCHHDRIE